MNGAVGQGWRSLLRPEWIPTLAILLGGVLVQSMNVLMLVTMLPSIVGELGGVAMLSWPTTAYLASSIVAASCAGMLANTIGARMAYCAGLTTFAVGALLCSVAPAMGWVVAGRLIQGFGGGLEAAVAYVLVRQTFPQSAWSRAIALMSTSWSVSVLIGPLVGGTFAQFGSWRSAFVATAAAAACLAIVAIFVLPSASQRTSATRVPALRIALICLAIGAMSLASVTTAPFARIGLIVAAAVLLGAMVRLNRSAATAMLPRDAFSWRTQTGVALWLVLLLCLTFSPLHIYMAIFLQQLHGLAPLAAGFSVAAASLAWTVASLATAGTSGPWPDRVMSTGPATMGVSLVLIALLTPHAAVLPLIAAIAALGAGIGQCWPFVAHRVLAGAQPGDETVAAASVPTVQQIGFALGAAIAGLIANASGLSAAIADDGMIAAAFWVPVSFTVPAVLAALTGLRLRHLRKA